MFCKAIVVNVMVCYDIDGPDHEVVTTLPGQSLECRPPAGVYKKVEEGFISEIRDEHQAVGLCCCSKSSTWYTSQQPEIPERHRLHLSPKAFAMSASIFSAQENSMREGGF